MATMVAADSHTMPRQLQHGRRGLALAAVCVLLFLTFLDNTIVSVALGDIQTETHAGVQSLQWIVNGYALVFAGMMLPLGALGDRIGQRTMMVAGAAVFAAGSIVCALAPSSGVLIGGRAVMGLGAAASEPATLAMLRHLYPGRRLRARATGVWAAVAGLALALGPVVGGLIVGIAGWRWIFWFNLTFGLACLAVGARLLPETAKTTHRRVDVVGAVLGAGALAMLVFAVTEGESAGFSSSGVVVLFCGAVASGVGFAWRQRRSRHPLLDLRDTRLFAFAAANIVSLAVYFGTFAVFFFCALYLDVVVGDSGFEIAAQFAPMTVAMIVASLATGRWVGSKGPALPIAAGCVLFAVGLLLTDASLSTRPAAVPLALSLMLAGIGLGITIVPTTSMTLDAVPPDRAGMASSALNTSREVGAVIGTAVLGAIVTSSLVAHLDVELDRLGLGALKKAVVPDVLHGGAAFSGAKGGTENPFVRTLLDSVYSAFSSALHACLVVSAAVVVAAGVAATVMVRRDPAEQLADVSVPTPSSVDLR
jgi:EmrB/QacA subfamily drug resistance transporter